MRLLLTILAVTLLLSSPAPLFAADPIAGDLKVVSTEPLEGGKIRVRLEAYHKQGAFSAGKTYDDRYAVPQDLLAKNYLPVAREWGALEGRGELVFEEMKREGYLVRIHLDKNWITNGDVKFRLALILANDGTQPTPGAVPTLVSPLSGVHEYKPGDILPLIWKGTGPNYRIDLYSETHGQTVLTASTRKPELRVNTAALGRNAVYAWTVRQADEGLAFGEPAVERFRVYSRNQLEWVSCRNCNGTGHVYVPDPPPAPHKGKGMQACPVCHGSGRVSEWVEHFFLDFTY